MQGPMLKALRRFTQLLRVHIYVPGCCKYIRMTNGLQPLVELCMDGCFAGQTGLMHVRLLLTQHFLALASVAYWAVQHISPNRPFERVDPDKSQAGLRFAWSQQSRRRLFFCSLDRKL